ERPQAVAVAIPNIAKLLQRVVRPPTVFPKTSPKSEGGCAMSRRVLGEYAVWSSELTCSVLAQHVVVKHAHSVYFRKWHPSPTIRRPNVKESSLSAPRR